MHPTTRAYRPSDLDAIYDICVRTGAAGGDARGNHSSDRLLGDIWAVPYVTREPEHAHVLDDGAGNAVGYILGTADTAAFVKWYRAEWLPATEGRYPDGDPRDEVMLGLHRDPERMLLPELADYPAHLHIDLLPEWQGKGLGRGLMAAFLDGLRAAGVPRVHLGMAPENHGAHAFYRRLGFRDLVVPDAGALYLGRDTSPL
ncbi:GNAT family N-acetyltransferase [Actinoplanes aureus]|uniref:GNAT family N-acetyltransferase n=1 Tax=Actinoplanes aureus TaxID=2792083 RepID=A0A931FYA6_9ACTN|nr:GNAT family N-acetyltransferase [Actinoplanes aureus]MBG0563577.1 GNAT family N-acetyltransferase [Actinoplanes aureus]